MRPTPNNRGRSKQALDASNIDRNSAKGEAAGTDLALLTRSYAEDHMSDTTDAIDARAEQEVWKPIAQFPRYQASSLGRVRGPKSILRPQRHPGGYLKVSISDRPRSKRMQYVHRLVCEAFHGPPPSPKHDAAHDDNNRSNNDPKNLRWATRSSNLADRDRHGTMRRGEDAPGAKLTNQQVAEIRTSTRTCESLSREYGVSPTVVSLIKRGLHRA